MFSGTVSFVHLAARSHTMHENLTHKYMKARRPICAYWSVFTVMPRTIPSSVNFHSCVYENEVIRLWPGFEQRSFQRFKCSAAGLVVEMILTKNCGCGCWSLKCFLCDSTFSSVNFSWRIKELVQQLISVVHFPSPACVISAAVPNINHCICVLHQHRFVHCVWLVWELIRFLIPCLGKALRIIAPIRW